MKHPSQYHGTIEHVQDLPNDAEYIRSYGVLHINPQNAREATLTTNDHQTLHIQHGTRINPAYNTKYMHVLGIRTKANPTIIHSELLYVAIPHATNSDVIIYAHRHNDRKWKYSKRYDVLAQAITRNPRIIALSLTPPKDPNILPWVIDSKPPISAITNGFTPVDANAPNAQMSNACNHYTSFNTNDLITQIIYCQYLNTPPPSWAGEIYIPIPTCLKNIKILH